MTMGIVRVASMAAFAAPLVGALEPDQLYGQLG